MAAINLGAKKRATFHELRVADVRPLTDTSVEVTFEVPTELADYYDYSAGQYLALRATIEGEEISSSLIRYLGRHLNGRISVAIKRDIGGLFSNWANDTLKPGQAIDVMTPQGTFTSKLDELDGKQIVGIAAGSGITPVITMAHRVLEQSDISRFDLLYTNKSSLDVMFVEELADLKDRYPDRLALHHVLSREQRSAPIMSGRLHEEKLRTILTTLIPTNRVNEWVLCGPFELVQLTRDLLTEYGVDEGHVRFELFTTGEPGAPAGPSGSTLRFARARKHLPLTSRLMAHRPLSKARSARMRQCSMLRSGCVLTYPSRVQVGCAVPVAHE